MAGGQISLREDFTYVVAIDIGTFYSGYAYAARSDIYLESKQINITSNQAWNSGNPNLITMKTPTSILLDKDQKLVSFGFEAENKFCELVDSGEIIDYFFCQRFKMELYGKEKMPTLDMVIKDIFRNKELPAVRLFAMSILAMKMAFREDIERQGIKLSDKDIRWVLTVPAIWSDAAKQFMRICAIEAKIPNNQLIIALEPEAGSIYCQYIPMTVIEPLTQCIVVDLGGGTVDITVHEKMETGFLREVHQSTGSDCGGFAINRCLRAELVRVFGAPFVNELQNNYPSVFFDFHREFEAAKKIFRSTSVSDIGIRISSVFLDKIAKLTLGEDMKDTIAESPHGDGVRIHNDRIFIKAEIFREVLFKPTAENIRTLINEVFLKVNNPKLTKILLIGGLAESEFIQTFCRSSFENEHLKVIIPRESGICVLKGAVLFGHHVNLISQRVVRFTYGVALSRTFDSAVDDQKRKVIVEGLARCKGAFGIFIKAGTVVNVDHKETKHFFTISKFQKKVELQLYISKCREPVYIDDEGCTKIGNLTIIIPSPSDIYRKLETSMIFGNTELNVCTTDLTSGEKCETTLDFLL